MTNNIHSPQKYVGALTEGMIRAQVFPHGLLPACLHCAERDRIPWPNLHHGGRHIIAGFGTAVRRGEEMIACCWARVCKMRHWQVASMIAWHRKCGRKQCDAPIVFSGDVVVADVHVNIHTRESKL